MSIASRIEFAFGADLTASAATWTWTDVSLYALDSVRVTFGRADEASQTQPTSCVFRLRNTDARFSPRFPTSPYYPSVRRQTPVRVSMNPGTGYVQRFQGYVDDIVPSWPAGNSDYAEVAVTASGLLRRLGQGNNILRSSLFRAITTSSVQPSAYWPCEDGADRLTVTNAVSPIVNVSSMVGVGASNFASADGAPGSDRQPTFGEGGSLAGAVPPVGAVTSWRIQCVVRCGTITSPAFAVPLEWDTADGTGWELIANALVDGGLGYSDTNIHTFISNSKIDDGQWHEWRATATQSGGNIVINVFLDGVLVINQTFAGTLTAITRVYSNRAGSSTNVLNGVGHFTVWNSAISTPGLDTVDSMRGRAGETAGARIVRLCGEQSIPVSVSSTAGTALMGPQGVATLSSLLRDCESVDGGILYDGQAAGLNYLARQDRYNLPVALALDTRRQQVKLPFLPIEGDQRVRNDWTLSRPGGSSARFTDPTHIAANGLYDTSGTINVRADGDLLDQAGWRVNLGTVEEMRVSGLSLQLIDHPELWASWFATTLGERLTAVNLPVQYPPGTLDMILEGAAETWDAVSWKVDLNTSPFAPWRVIVLASDVGDTGEFVGHLDTDGSTLTADITSTAMSIGVATSSGPLWTTDSDDFPFDLDIAGERVTATAAASTIRDTFTRSASSGWGTADSGQSWVVGAGTASLFSATGSVGQIAVSAINSEHHIAVNVGYAPRQRVRTYLTVGVTPTGAAINWGVMLRRADASNLYWIDVQVGTIGSLTLRAISKIAAANTQLATATSATVHSTSVARILVAEIDAANIIRAKVWADGATEPDWELVYDASAVVGLSTGPSVGCIARLATGNLNAAPVNFQFDNFSVLNPQTFTVVRSVNGVVKSQLAEAAVSLWAPLVLGL